MLRPYVSVLALLPVFFGGCFQKGPGDRPLRVMTYNIRFDNPEDSTNAWKYRRGYLISQVNFWAPDILGTQEGLIHQLEEMDGGMPDHAFFGAGRDFGDRRGEHTAIFYDTTRLELLDQGTFWLSETPEVPSRGWDAALNRTCTYGKFRLRGNGKIIWAFNTHFDHVGTTARAESVALILRRIKALVNDEAPVVLLGDLNLEPDSGPIQLLTAAMEDAYLAAGSRAHGPPGTFNGFDPGLSPTRRIDYIFLSPGDFKIIRLATLSERRVEGYPSDHFPVYGELRFSP